MPQEKDTGGLFTRQGRAQCGSPAAAGSRQERRLLLIAAASRIPAGTEQRLLPGEKKKGLPLIGRAVLTHGRQGRLCPWRGLRAGWGAVQEGLPPRGGDPAPIWSRKIKVTGGASGSGQ